MQNKKLQKAEDFIGWKSDDGLLEVIGIYGKQGKDTKFKVICHKCKEDSELFPDGYFVSTKGNLINNGNKPCGCAKSPRWNKEQYLILARRAAKGRFIVHGFAEDFHGAKTKLHLTCLKDGYKWSAGLSNIIHNGTGCPQCAARPEINEQKASEVCAATCEKEGYEFIGFIMGYKNAFSHFEYKCEKHGIQKVSYNDFVSGRTRCKYCAIDSRKVGEKEAISKCTAICKAENYTIIGFPEGYINNLSRLEYICPLHGNQSVSYSAFVNSGNRCLWCAKDKQKELGNGNGYFPERKDEVDYLYVLNFNDKFIKVGRSFDVDKRIRSLGKPSESGIKNIHKLRIFTATHQEIYDLEQELHSELRERNFQHYVKWSTECFTSDSLPFLNMLLDKCGLEEVKL